MEDCVIKVNGVEITGSRSFPQSELEQAEVQVAAPGYLTYMGMIDLATNEQALIELMPDRGHDGVADADAGRRQGPQTIPSHSGRKSMRWWQKALFVFLGIGLALGGCYLFMPELFDVAGSKKFASASTETVPPNSIAAGKMRVDNVTTTVGDTAKERNIAESQAVAQPNTQNKQENAQSKQESAQAARQESAGNAAQGAKPAENQSQTQKPAEAKPADENAVAVKYLDGNAYWKESEVASNSLLKSYYNDLLNFNLNALANEWPKKLPASKWVATVARHAREALGKKLDPKAKGNTYTLSGKGKIHRQEYINWINRRKE